MVVNYVVMNPTEIVIMQILQPFNKGQLQRHISTLQFYNKFFCSS